MSEPPPLRPSQLRQVLDYWLASIRFEEALTSRPKAFRPAERPDSPAGVESMTQSYLRLGTAHSDFFFQESLETQTPLDEAGHRFLGHWLRRTRRAERREGSSESSRERLSWLAGWPAVFNTRREEIATLFRFPVELEWRRAGEAWDPGRDRAPPDTLRLRTLATPAGDDGDDGDDEPTPTLWVDRALLHHTFGVLEEDLDALNARWGNEPVAADAMVADIVALLGPSTGREGTDGSGRSEPRGTSFEALVRACASRLPDGYAVYPCGIVQDAGLVFATYHLQRELGELVELLSRDRPLAERAPLWSYLGGPPTEQGWSPLRARFRPHGLTASQRHAAEVSLGSRLSAVQGPPGTGKTEVILNLCAHALVRQITALDEGRSMDVGLSVITSTNNRAVDNVIEPLTESLPAGFELPLGLRVGNQDVTSTVTVRQLTRALSWLQAQGDAGASDALRAAREEFRAVRRAFDEATAPEVERRERRAALAQVRRELEGLRSDPAIEASLESSEETFALVREGLERLLRIVASRSRGKEKLSRVQAQQSRLTERSEVGELLRALGLPPAREEGATPEQWLDAWEDALEEAREQLASLRQAAARRRRLERDLRALEEHEEHVEHRGEVERPAPGSPGSTESETRVEALGHALFVASLRVRERWAVVHKPALVGLLLKARASAMEQRSLKRFFVSEEAEGGAARLAALYPVLGCTLLSLGNVLEHEPDSIGSLIIDEAGQCHPAFAVCGLSRATRALLIGDVHQLAPVVLLTERDEARVLREHALDLPESQAALVRVHARAQTSAQALADRAVVERPSLTDHFRCQPGIIEVSNALCGYGLTVRTPRRSFAERAPRLVAPLLLADVSGRQRRARGSWSNEREAEVVVQLLLELRASGLRWDQLGVVAPYVGQVELLRSVLRGQGVPLELPAEDLNEQGSLGLALGHGGRPDVLSIGTVHRFQGGERPIMLFSTVVTERRSLPFLDERPNLLNVALSRARDHLVVIGDAATLAQGRHTRVLMGQATPVGSAAPAMNQTLRV